VEADVEKSEETEHTAEADEVREVEELAERRDAKGEDEKAQSPIAGGMLQELNGIRAELALEGAPNQARKRRQTKKKYRNFGPLAYK
jgi:hypothetical protein